MKFSDISPLGNGIFHISPSEDKPNVREELADTQRIQADESESYDVSLIMGSKGSIYDFYDGLARASEVPTLEFDEFWNRFERRFPGTYFGRPNFTTNARNTLGPCVFVMLGPKDKSLANLIDTDGTFSHEGSDAILYAIIETQDSLSGEPLRDLMWWE